ncbi:HD domain-containing protein [Amycolatopsis rhabdoformis]|uniref:HD domain-containing protein n=1 Tax=Amycolatopsis rhabdoformis TaxID=1448059 RepID=A0ABZ1IBL8_9PSEU|nr:HD domain-containing protein [Amycolatopsis rhabdoformis]WSE31812.1 HD domain-containing protein [Amycolatopsis rhabdoformis]
MPPTHSAPAAVEPAVRPCGALIAWAWSLAQRHLSRELPRRWQHVQGVAECGRRIGERLLTGDEEELLVAAALLHDIGYAPGLVVSGYHPLDGARFLVAVSAPPRLVNLVARHSAAEFVAEQRGLTTDLARFPDEHSTLRDALWFCDMRTTQDGRPTTFAERIASIRARHGPQSHLVRALDAGGQLARHDAVRRTELRLGAAVLRRVSPHRGEAPAPPRGDGDLGAARKPDRRAR